jgi:outer membrane usher protein
VVEVGDYPDVRIYADNQEVGRTDERGRLLVPGLRPYELNRLRIEQADLPLGANVDGLAREIIPRWRSGVLAAFPVSRSRDGLFRIVLESGRPLPSGALVLDADDRAWPVGREGRVFVTGLAQRNRFRVQHDDLRCSFEIAGPEGAEPLPDLGTVICRSAR